jgi:hypothetical protein
MKRILSPIARPSTIPARVAILPAVAARVASRYKRIMMTATRNLFWAALSLATAACSGCNNPPPPVAPPPAPMPLNTAVAPLPAQPIPCDQAEMLATSTSMQARADKEASHMKPEGLPICARVAEGQTVTGPLFTLEAGYCYTILGQSLPPASQMEVMLVADAGGLIGQFAPGMANAAQMALVVTQTPGERVAVPGQGCYQPPLMPAPVKLVLKARAGSGPIAAQVYKKKVM